MPSLVKRIAYYVISSYLSWSLFGNSSVKLFIPDPKRRRSHDDGLADDDNLEKRLENMDVYLSARKQFGAKKVWSERLEADLMRASMFRIARRGDLKKKMRKPYEAWDSEKGKWKPKPNWLLGESEENPIDAGDRKAWSAIGPSLTLTVLVVVLYFLTSSARVKLSESELTWRTLLYGSEWEKETKES